MIDKDQYSKENPSLEVLLQVQEVINRPLDLVAWLDQTLEIVIERLKAEAGAVFLLEKGTETLTLQATRGFPNPKALRQVRFKFGVGIAGWVAQHRQPAAVPDVLEDERYQLFEGLGEEGFRSLLSFPLEYRSELVGVVSVRSVEVREWSWEEIQLMRTLSTQLSGAIRNAQLYQEAQRHLRIFSVLFETSKTISSTLRLQDLLDLIAKTAAELTQSEGCVLRLLESNRKVLKIGAVYGNLKQIKIPEEIEIDQEISGLELKNGKPYLLKNAHEIERISCTIENEEIHSILCLPLIFKNQIVGTLRLINKVSDDLKPHPYTEEDQQIITMLGSLAASALENARLYQEISTLAELNEQKAIQLLKLLQISEAMQSTLSLSKRLRMILAAVTFHHGMGFDRALLFLVDKESKKLQGVIGSGSRIWLFQSRRGSELDHIFANLDLESWMRKRVTEGASRYDSLAKSISISLQDKDHLFVKTILEKKPYNITEASNNPNLDKETLEKLQVENFAIVPLIATDDAVGAIYVDNQRSGKMITQEDLDSLMTLSEPAGQAIEIATLYKKLKESSAELRRTQDLLIQSEKLSALGKMAANVAHEIRNPLISIGGFARKLDRHLAKSDPGHRYTKIIIDEVIRLEKILRDVLDFSTIKTTSYHFEPNNIVKILNEVLDLMNNEFEESNIKIDSHLADQLPDILSDRDRIKQVFINLFSNSIQAMPRGGIISVWSYQNAKDDPLLTVEISDTGGGIATEVLENIFNPFFTTKERGFHNGLGLAICHKIIEAHHGSIQVKNDPGHGVSFIINFPTFQQNPELKFQKQGGI